MKNGFLTIPLLIVIAGCTVHRIDYVYFYPIQSEIEATEFGSPSVEAYRGDPIPIAWDINTSAGTIQMGIGKETFIPDVVVTSDNDIVVEASPSCAFVYERSSREVAVHWGFWRGETKGCVNLGDKLTVTIEFREKMEKITIVGEVRQAGTFRYIDSL